MSIAVVSCGGGGNDGSGGATPAGTPMISGVLGGLSNGQSITIVGSSFGSKSHAGPMLWDDFDSGSNGAIVAGDSTGAAPLVHQGNLAGYSQWQLAGGGNYTGQAVVFDNSSPKANSPLHARATFLDSTYWGLNLYVPYAQFTTGSELYMSFYFRMTRTGAASPKQLKAWIAYDSTDMDKLYWSTAYDNCEAGPYRMHITELVQEQYFSNGGVDTIGEWVRFETYLKQSGPDVSDGMWLQAFSRPSIGIPQREFHSVINQKLRTSTADFVHWTFGGAYYDMCTGAEPGTIDIDDFYMDSTQARVEICNAPTFSASTKCELQLPTAWSDGSITAVFNKGYLESSSAAYVYIINAAGSVNAQGFAVAIP
jgi:hypothetical protein